MDKTNALIVRRESKGLSRKALADALGVTERTVRRWEDGERMPRPSDLRSLETLIGVSASEVVEIHLRSSTHPPTSTTERKTPA